MKSKAGRICAGILILLIVFILGDIWLSANWLTVRNYEFEIEKTEQEVKFVVLSDLHGHEFGKDNRRLVEKVRGQGPDFILLDGDFLNESSGQMNITSNLIEALCDVSPVYFALGNHEKNYMENHDKNLIERLEKAGAKVLEEEYVDFDIEGTALRLGGMFSYAFAPNGKAETLAGSTGGFLKDFQNTDRVKIMMSHRPDSFIFGDAASYWDIDLGVSGHNHGGQIVLPFLGGVYAGDQGWFPKYIHGTYQKDEMRLFITSGLGSENQALPRFHNLPEIAVVTIK